MASILKTILIVENDEMTRRSMELALGEAGHRVFAAANPSEATHIARTFREEIHLLIANVIMPEMPGSRLFQCLAALRPQMKVIYISGYNESGMAQDWITDKTIPILQKPFSPDLLLRVVREILA